MTGIPVVARAIPDVRAWLHGEEARILRAFTELIAIDTASPKEIDAFAWLSDYFTNLGAAVITRPQHPELHLRPEANYNSFSALSAEQRANLKVEFPVRQEGRPRTLFSAHVDVVPPNSGFAKPFTLRCDGATLVGRGVSDTKGNILMLGEALRYLRDHRLPMVRDVSVDLVIEEEIGGNGALSCALYRPDVDEVVVLEPTGLEVMRGHRGCVEFTARITGRSSHMGGAGRSAIRTAFDLVAALENLETRLIGEARQDPAFGSWPRPIQINVGRIHGGQWRGSLAERCDLGVSFGFLPRYDLADAKRILETEVAEAAAHWPDAEVRIEYDGIHNGAYLMPPGSRLERDLTACTPHGLPAEAARGWLVSCDARLYYRLLGVPTVVFGAGRLEAAHASDESLLLEEWRQGVAALVRFLSPLEGGE